jgi:hypothetical protein
MNITYRWRGEFTNEALNHLHAEGFGHPLLADEWWAQVTRHSLGWVCAARCEWLHVDFEDHLREFYFDRCGFEPTNGGLVKLV